MGGSHHFFIAENTEILPFVKIWVMGVRGEGKIFFCGSIFLVL